MATMTRNQESRLVATETLTAPISKIAQKISQTTPQELKALLSTVPLPPQREPVTPSTTSTATAEERDTSEAKSLITPLSTTVSENDREIATSSKQYQEQVPKDWNAVAERLSTTKLGAHTSNAKEIVPGKAANDRLSLAMQTADASGSTGNSEELLDLEVLTESNKALKTKTSAFESIQPQLLEDVKPQTGSASADREKREASGSHEAAHKASGQEQEASFMEVDIGKSRIFRIEKHAFVSPNSPVDPILLDKWSNQIQGRLEREIAQTMRSWMPDEFSIVLHCMMAGRSITHLKPHIVVFCTTEAIRQQLVKHIKNYNWLAAYKIPCLVAVHRVLPLSSLSPGAIVGLTVGILAFVLAFALAFIVRVRLYTWGVDKLVSRLISMLPAPASSYPGDPEMRPNMVAELNFRSHESHGSAKGLFSNARQGSRVSVDGSRTEKVLRHSLCGVPLGLVRPAGTGPDRTLGGIILVNGVAFGLTVAHGHDGSQSSSALTAKLEDQVEEGVTRETEQEDVEPIFISFGEGARPDDSDMSKISEVPATVIAGPSNTLRASNRKFATNQGMIGSEVLPIPSITSDWAIINFGPLPIVAPNKYSVPQGQQAIKSIMKGSDLTAGPVYVLAGSSDSQVGTLDQTPVSLWRDGGFLRARQIMISSKLVKGDSGSWVVRDEALCGHIVAGPAFLPWAYMLPMHEIVEDIKECHGARTVELPR